ncbi:hypothetical protein E0L93_00045 [Rubrobacter taiwanensis]|jgi:hypothetical protein|uniref:Uncharacterized protein n=1 Tax=Rubrobacter taiwanensis TaxID=185139 RepID=A0A4R1BS64_9ACTN|nr:hypothetical protein [Rubrobacter taiwanensis]TCJ20659.1 hypothetical protein E0L93_00045 [Rubrobacter taiwanensis]
MDLVPVNLALGALLIFIGLLGLGYGLYALLRGGKGQEGGIGPIPERGVHAIAGIRMLIGGGISTILGALLLWGYFSG